MGIYYKNDRVVIDIEEQHGDNIDYTSLVAGLGEQLEMGKIRTQEINNVMLNLTNKQGQMNEEVDKISQRYHLYNALVNLDRDVDYENFAAELDEARPDFELICTLPHVFLQKHLGALLLYIIKNYLQEKRTILLLNFIDNANQADLQKSDGAGNTVLHLAILSHYNIANQVKFALIDHLGIAGLVLANAEHDLPIHLALFYRVDDRLSLALLAKMSVHDLNKKDRNNDTILEIIRHRGGNTLLEKFINQRLAKEQF